jgi:hypothetical protein
MSGKIGLLSIIGLIGLLVATDTKVAAQPAASLDGTYPLVSAVKLNQTYVTRQGQTGFCPESTPSPLSISQGRVWYVSSSGRHLAGTVSPQGQILIRVSEPRDSSRGPFEMDVTGVADGAGTVRARQRGNSCSYDLTWRRQ